MRETLRQKAWLYLRRDIPAGQILPWWALTARAVLFPLDFFYWRMSQSRGYQWQNDTWLINGETFKAQRVGGKVVMQKVEESQ